MRNVYKILISFLAILAIFGVGVGVGYGLNTYVSAQSQPSDEEAEAFGLFWEVWNIVEEQFYDRTRLDTAATYGAIRGSLQTLDDPYTVFIEPQPRALERARLDGQFGGIGAYILRDEAGQVLLDPMVDSPAEQAGLQRDDILRAVNGTEIAPEMTTDDVVLLVRGEVGTEVQLLIERAGNADLISMTITRAVIETPSVTWQILEDEPQVGYIKISMFSNRTNRELDRAFAELEAAGAQKYLVDLRGNGGGLLDAAIDVASRFVRQNTVILNEDRRNAEAKIYRAGGGTKQLDAPLVVLVDGGTASASEIVAGALQDHNRAILIGESTYGKGSVQLVYDLSDESSLHVTVAKWFTPDNNSIDGVGLQPDMEILFTEEDHANGNDPQYQAALEYLRQDADLGYNDAVGN